MADYNLHQLHSLSPLSCVEPIVTCMHEFYALEVLYVQFKCCNMQFCILFDLHNGTAFILPLTLCSLHYNIHMLEVSDLVKLYCYATF